MPSNFPTSLDSYAGHNPGDIILDTHVDNVEDAIEAIEAAVGITSSAVTTSHDYRIAQLERGDVGQLRIATITEYGGLPNNNATLTTAGYASTAAAITANPSWSALTGAPYSLATSDRVNWAALQAAFLDWANWDKLLVGGTLQINKTLIEPSNENDFLGRTIAGTSDYVCVIEQVTANTPIIATEEEGGGKIAYRYVKLKMSSLAGASDTEAIGFKLDSTTPSIGYGHSNRTWDHVEIENCYDAIAATGDGFSGMWGCLLTDVTIRNFRHSAIDNEPTITGGLPGNVAINLQIINTASGIAQTGTVLNLPSNTWIIDGLNIEGCYNTLISCFTGGIVIDGLRVEWQHVTGANPIVFDLSFGSYIIRGHDISFDEINFTGVGRVWLVGDEGSLFLDSVTWTYSSEPDVSNLHWIYTGGDPFEIRNRNCHVNSTNAFTDVMLDTPPDGWGPSAASIDPIVEWGGGRGGAVTAGAITNGTTLSTARGAVICSNGSAVTGIILAAGKIHGQTVDVVATGAGGITFATDATSLVHGGTGVSVTAGTARRFVWYHTGSVNRWYPQMV